MNETEQFYTKASGEWTKKNMAGKWSRGEEWIIAAHNAALAAEREQVKKEGIAGRRIFEQLREQLAAERERADKAAERERYDEAAIRAELAQSDLAGLQDTYALLLNERDKLQEELAAEREKYDQALDAYAEVRAQLAAERKCSSDRLTEMIRLQQQLAAERSATLYCDVHGTELQREACNHVRTCEQCLADERELGRKEGFDEGWKFQHAQWEKQLAAEQEVGHNQAVTLGQHIARLEDQLAAALAKLEKK